MKKIGMTCVACILLLTLSVTAQNKKRIAVLPFKNKGGLEKSAWLSEGFATTLTEGLQQIQAIYVVDRNQVNSVIKKGKYSNDDLFTSKGAYEIGKKLGLDYVIIGAFSITKGTINSIAIVVDAKKEGEYIQSCSPNLVKPMASLWQIYDELIDVVCKAACFNVKVTAGEVKQIKDITQNTQNVSAYEYYIKGRKEHLKYSLKAYGDAISLYDKALELDPNYALALGAKGEAEAYSGYQKETNGEEYKYLYESAEKHVQKALTVSPNIASIHTNMATTYQNLLRFDDAVVEASKAVGLNPNDAEAWYRLWSAKGAGADAEEIKKALTISPYLPIANLSLGNAYSKDKNYDKAIEYYKRALIGNDEYELAHVNIGRVYIILKNYDDAIVSLKRTMEIKPNYAFAWERLGYAYEMQGNALKKTDEARAAAKYNESLTAYQRAVEINPKDAFNHNSVAWGYSNLGRWADALSEWQQALRLDPTLEEAKKQIEVAKKQLGQ